MAFCGVTNFPPCTVELLWRGANSHPTVRETRDPIYLPVDCARLICTEYPRVIRHPNWWAWVLHRGRAHCDAIEIKKPSFEGRWILRPQHTQHLDAFLHPGDPFSGVNLHCIVLGSEVTCDIALCGSAADTGRKHRSALGKAIERTPLCGKHYGMAQGETRHAGSAKPASLCTHGERRQECDGLKPGFGK